MRASVLQARFPTDVVTMYKVLMVGPDRMLPGGIVTVVNGLLSTGFSSEIKVDYLGTGHGDGLVRKCLSFCSSLWEYRKVITDYDLVHFHVSARGSFWRKALMCRIAQSRGKAIVLHEHSGEFAKDYEAAPKWKKRIVRNVFSSADAVIALSRTWLEFFENELGCNNVSVICNGVPVPDREAAPSTSNQILYLGRLDDNKNPAMLIEAVRELKSSGVACRCIFAGNGDVERYENMAEAAGVGDVCEFAGWVNGKKREEFILTSTLLCMTSYCEGLPMSMLECMSFGIPVVATAVGGIPDVILDGVNGVLIPPGDSHRLAKVLAKMLADPALRAKMGRAARDGVKSGYSVDRVCSEIECLYKELIANREVD